MTPDGEVLKAQISIQGLSLDIDVHAELGGCFSGDRADEYGLARVDEVRAATEQIDHVSDCRRAGEGGEIDALFVGGASKISGVFGRFGGVGHDLIDPGAVIS